MQLYSYTGVLRVLEVLKTVPISNEVRHFIVLHHLIDFSMSFWYLHLPVKQHWHAFSFTPASLPVCFCWYGHPVQRKGSLRGKF